MTTITSGPAAETLTRLHREADAADGAFKDEMMAKLAASGQTVEAVAAKLIDDERRDYASLYRLDHGEHFLNVSPDYGQFLYAITRATKAKRIVEFGTSMGISTIYLAAGLRDNGGGQVIGSELAANKVMQARTNLESAGLADLVDSREGDAVETLRDVGGSVELLLLDGAWSLYLSVLKMIEPILLPGAVVLGENAFDAEFLAYVAEPTNGYRLLPVAVDEERGNTFAVRVA